MSYLSIILSVLLAMILFFYIYTFASYFKITIWVLVDRISYYSPFDFYVISKDIDHLIIASATVLWLVLSIRNTIRYAIATIYGIATILVAIFTQGVLLELMAVLSAPIIIVLLILNKYGTKNLVSKSYLLINYLVILGIGIGLAGVVISLGTFYLPSDALMSMRNHAYEIYAVFSSFSPIILTILILSFPVKLITDQIIKSTSRLSNIIINNMLPDEDIVRPLKKITLLLIFMSLSASMAIIPHHELINFDSKDVGVDTHYYVEWTILLMNSTSMEEFVKQSFVFIQHGDRPLTLLFFFTLANIVPSNNLSYLFEYVPIILGPALVLVVYFLTRQLTSNDIASLLSAFLTAVSIHTLVGIYAGSYANWLALIVGYLTMIFLLRSLKKCDKFNCVIFFALMVTLLLTHLYTWSILTIVMGIFLFVLLKLNYYERKHVVILLVILALTMSFDVVRMALTGAFSGIGYGISPPFGELRLGPEQFLTRWSSLIDTTQNYYGSLFGNSVIYVIALYWLVRSRIKEMSSIFIISFLSIGIIPLFLGNWIVQSRVFYDIPFQIPASIALAYIYKKHNGAFMLIPIIIWLLAISIIAVSNFYYIPPS